MIYSVDYIDNCSKIMMVSDSAFELLSSIQLRCTLLKNKDTSLIITDQNSNSEILYSNLKKSDLFTNVFHAKAKNFPKCLLNTQREIDEISKDPDLYRKLCQDYLSNELFKGINQKYDLFISSEEDMFSRAVYWKLKKDNQNIKAALLGEGMMTYSDFHKITSRTIISNPKYSFKDFSEDYQVVFMMRRDLFHDNTKIAVEYPDFSEVSSNTLQRINQIMGYKPGKQRISNKIIYFEGGYVTDGGKIDDVNLVQYLASHYGKENVMVKCHPRSREDRFADIGVGKIDNSYIPWEVTLLNGDCENSVFMAAYSLSIMHPIVFNIGDTDAKSIALFNMLDIYVDTIHKDTDRSDCVFYKKIMQSDSRFLIPGNYDQLQSYIDSELKRRKIQIYH